LYSLDLGSWHHLTLVGDHKHRTQFEIAFGNLVAGPDLIEIDVHSGTSGKWQLTTIGQFKIDVGQPLLDAAAFLPSDPVGDPAHMVI